MYVSASTDCFPQLTLPAALERLIGLEYTRVEVVLRENSPQLAPSEVHANLERAIMACRESHRITPVAYVLEQNVEDPAYYDQFTTCCKLAKATKVVSLTVPAAELGTPFNKEIERLRELVRIASLEGVLVSLRTEAGRLTEDPATAAVLCDNVKGLGLTLDPSHYIFGGRKVNYDPLFKYVYNTQLRDTTKDAFQVRVGQGEIEYGRLAAQLAKFNYNRALSVSIVEQPGSDIDHSAEMRKMRLLLESMV